MLLGSLSHQKLSLYLMANSLQGSEDVPTHGSRVRRIPWPQLKRELASILEACRVQNEAGGTILVGAEP